MKAIDINKYWNSINPDAETERRIFGRLMAESEHYGYIDSSASSKSPKPSNSNKDVRQPKNKHSYDNRKSDQHYNRHKYVNILAGAAVFAIVAIGIFAIYMASGEPDGTLGNQSPVTPPVNENTPMLTSTPMPTSTPTPTQTPTPTPTPTPTTIPSDSKDIRGNWYYVKTTVTAGDASDFGPDSGTPYIINEFDLAPPTIEIYDDFSFTAVFYGSVFRGQLAALNRLYTFVATEQVATGEGQEWYPDDARVEYFPGSGLLRWTTYNEYSDEYVNHYFSDVG